MPLPRPARIIPARLRVAVGTFRAADNLRFAVTGDVGEGWRFVVRYVQRDMLLPVAFAALRVFIPGGDFAGKTENQDVVPALLIEIVGEREKVDRVGVVG